MSRITGATCAVTNVSLNGSNQAVIGANPQRNLLILANNSTTNIATFTLDGSTASATNGITVPAGTSYIFDVAVPLGAINVIGTNGQAVTVYQA